MNMVTPEQEDALRIKAYLGEPAIEAERPSWPVDDLEFYEKCVVSCAKWARLMEYPNFPQEALRGFTVAAWLKQAFYLGEIAHKDLGKAAKAIIVAHKYERRPVDDESPIRAMIARLRGIRQPTHEELSNDNRRTDQRPADHDGGGSTDHR